jgi:hypothetical protein
LGHEGNGPWPKPQGRPAGQREDAPVALVFGLSCEVGGEALEGVVGEADPNFA